MNSVTLLVLAAGMGSRYGGLKQLDAVGPNGETVIDYSVFDAIRAGFKKVVFIIREDFKKEFQSSIGNKFQSQIEVEYAYQKLEVLPPGYSLPQDREKPWGTGHAILSAKQVVNEPFAVINADDFYGKLAYQKIFQYLSTVSIDSSPSRFCMVGYPIINTLSEFGSVSRGICIVSDQNKLESVNELTCIQKIENEIVNEDEFLSENIDNLSSEFYIPFAVDNLIQSNIATVEVLETTEQWFGVTYKEDKSYVQSAVCNLIESGEYPSKI